MMKSWYSLAKKDNPDITSQLKLWSLQMRRSGMEKARMCRRQTISEPRPNEAITLLTYLLTCRI